MIQSNTRRAFLAALGGCSAITASVGGAARADASKKPKKMFKGASKKGDFGEALQEAIAAAERSVRHPDAMVEWTLKSVTGRNGGIAGFRDLTVVIEAVVH